ncbi:S1/P1 nuclease [Leptothrix discophora]|uniref:S1/P1 nuclease n=1 Tax=Leptothrix discophora TaxID=89 RepID=A0ABT9G7W1_LEPDI|nr:S1/P1 nuclease [Leptothrix discophora]MDP4302569.1 S1/P1 nuclease [Leptothrix discophora]
MKSPAPRTLATRSASRSATPLATTLATVLFITLHLLAPLLAPSSARAWGHAGHELIADLAQARLSPAADAEARRLLALDDATRLAEVASWADAFRTPMTARWHFVNLPPETCEYKPAEHCLKGQCAIEAVNRQLAVLALDPDDTERLQALRYIVHLVADLHQPLHAGRADDRGGNGYAISWRQVDHSTNLHALWDSVLIEARPGGLPALRRDVQARHAAPAAGSSPTDWAEASCRIARADGYYPAAHKIDARYAQRWDAALVGQIDLAAWHLAEVLDDVLTDPQRRLPAERKRRRGERAGPAD